MPTPQPPRGHRSIPVPVSQIQTFIHCKRCVEELHLLNEQAPVELRMSHAAYQQIEVGWTGPGLQVWCRRHACDIMHLNFEGRKVKLV